MTENNRAGKGAKKEMVLPTNRSQPNGSKARWALSLVATGSANFQRGKGAVKLNLVPVTATTFRGELGYDTPELGISTAVESGP